MSEDVAKLVREVRQNAEHNLGIVREMRERGIEEAPSSILPEVLERQSKRDLALCDALEERGREVKRLREALEAVVYDTDMKRNRWGLWTKAREALAPENPERG